MNRIVVGLGPSLSSRAALRWAARRAWATGTELRVVTAVVDPLPLAAMLGGGLPVVDLDSFRRRTADWQCSVVEEVLLEESVAPAVTSVVVTGRPSAVLAEHARSVDLLVLGSTRRRIWSTARSCRSSVNCPVIVIDGRRPA